MLDTKTLRTTTLAPVLLVGAYLCAGSQQIAASPRPDDEDSWNIIAAHDSNSSEYKKECKECHSAIHSEVSLDPGIAAAHRAMAPFAAGKRGRDDQCRWCHRTVDLQQGTQRVESSQGNVRRHVDVELCAFCHGPFGSGSSGRGGAPLFYQASAFSPTDPDGPTLYELLCAACHGPLETSEVRGDGDDIQKKIDEDEGGMGALDVLTAAEVQAIAAALGSEAGDDD